MIPGLGNWLVHTLQCTLQCPCCATAGPRTNKSLSGTQHLCGSSRKTNESLVCSESGRSWRWPSDSNDFWKWKRIHIRVRLWKKLESVERMELHIANKRDWPPDGIVTAKTLVFIYFIYLFFWQLCGTSWTFFDPTNFGRLRGMLLLRCPFRSLLGAPSSSLDSQRPEQAPPPQ